MSATETWLLVAAILAGVSALLHLAAPTTPPLLARLAPALHAAALAVVAIALILALP